MRRLAPLVIVISAFAGCGGGNKSSDGSEVTSVVHRYYAALARGDGAELCSLLSDTAKLRLSQKHVSCAGAVTAFHSLVRNDSAILARLRNVAVSSPVISGSGATVEVASIGPGARTVALSKASGSWRLDTVDTFKEEGIVADSRAGLEDHLAEHEVVAVTINKRIRTAHVTLRGGVEILVKYGPGQFAAVQQALRNNRVPVTIMSRPEAERDAASIP